MFILEQMLIAAVAVAHTTVNQDKLRILQSFVQRQVLYDDSTSVDSVITWSEQLLPALRTHEDRELYFLLQLQLANAYTLRGDIGLATNRAQSMYEEAQKSHYRFGIVTANQAIGDAYNTIANMYDRALESYRDALSELSHISGQHPYKAQLLLKESNTLQRRGQLEKAANILKEVEEWLLQKPDYPTSFFFYAEKANFAISHGHLSKSYLDEASDWIQRMDSIYRLHPEKFYRFHIDYVTAAYCRAMGNWDKQYWEQASDLYSKLRQQYSDNKHSTYYRWTSLEKIYLYKIEGKAMEACKIYQELYPSIDTLTSQNYIRQINIIKTKYKIDKLQTDSNQAYRKIKSGLLIGGFALLTLFVLFAIFMRRHQKALKLSTRKLVASRIRTENAIKIKSLLLSNMSHEIRTPLNALAGFSSLLTEEGIDSDTRLQCNEVIQQNSELLLKLINDVIDLSDLEIGTMQLSIARHNAVSICRNVIDTVNKVKQTQAELFFSTEAEEIMIETDASRLQQILINLLINATKFTPQGNITLELRREADHTVLFTVTDTGCGIPKEKQASVFRRFEKLDEEKQGSGLGLSICQLIIERIGGKIWIDPDYTEGARFCFTHPVNQPKANTQKNQK